MALSVCSFGSGSSGNCYLVKSKNNAILVDAGLSNKRICESLYETGVADDKIDGVFITHEHTDHTKGLRVLTKKHPYWKVYASNGTGERISESIADEDQLECFDSGSTIKSGDITLKSIKISHDAVDPVCYAIESGGSRLVILTDTGLVPSEAEEALSRSDIIIMEANHEVNVLKAGPYPYSLKLRILGDRGHLSNDTAGSTLAEAMSREKGHFRKIFLAHLSRKNNFPKLAYQTVKNILEENSFYLGRDFSLGVARGDGVSCIAEV